MGRRLYVAGELKGVDDENWPWHDEYGHQEFSRVVYLSGHQPQEVMEMEMRWGGECRSELYLTGSIQDNEAIRIEGELKLFEGTSEGTMDLDGQESFVFLIPPEGPGSKSVTVRNEDEGGDRVNMRITAFNLPE